MSDSLEAQTVHDRRDRLRELKEFTENCRKQLHDIFETLGWSQDYNDSDQVSQPVAHLSFIHPVPLMLVFNAAKQHYIIFRRTGKVKESVDDVNVNVSLNG